MCRAYGNLAGVGDLGAAMPRFAHVFTSLLVLAVVAVAVAADGRAAEPVNTDEGGVAIRGFDPVAYFTVGRPVQGVSAFEHEWRGATWRFANEEHLDRFAAEPRRYAPRYGGYCAGAMWRGFTAPIDPNAFAIVDGKLYLAYAKEIMQEFKEEAEDSVPTADANWARLSRSE